MRSTIQILAVFALIVATFSQPTNASAADVFKFKDDSASAFFSSIDPSGCINTGGSVFAFTDSSHSPPGPGSSSAAVLIDLFQYNFCTDTLLRSASGSADLASSDFQVTGNLDSATVYAIVPVYDSVSESTFNVTVDLTWTSTSSLGHQSSHIKVNFQGCHVNLKNNSAFRFAEASGTVSDGTTNFTPLPSTEATIFLAKGGEISHGCD
jgi:hypothetical protein